MMFAIIGFVVGFLLTTITFYLFGFDFDQRNYIMGFWFILAVVFGCLGSSIGRGYDK